MAAEEIARKDWYYILYRSDEGLLLSVLCGTVGMYDVTVLLTAEEAARYRADERYLDELAGAIRYSPDSYLHRRIAGP
jgi:hypothetical protein